MGRTTTKATKTYTARATRSGDWWAVEVDELEGVFTQARRIDQVEGMARDAIALLLDIDPDSFEVAVVPELPAEWRAELVQLHALRLTSEVLGAMATMKAVQIVRLLHEKEGLPMRDVGQALGVSHQRVHQLISAGDRWDTMVEELEDAVDRLSVLESTGAPASLRIAWKEAKAELGI